MSSIRTALAVKTVFNCVNLHQLAGKIRPTARCLSTISRFPVPDRNSLSADLQEVMNKVEEKANFVPNVFKALAHRPEELRAFLHYYDVVMTNESGITKAEKELIILATSAANNCSYCVVAHGALHRIFSKQPLIADQVATNWECAEISDREKAILKFAVKIGKAEPVKESDLEELEANGLTKEDAWDIGAVAALFALSNRMAHVMNCRPNEEFYVMGREKREKED
mgnify:FL=1